MGKKTRKKIAVSVCILICFFLAVISGCARTQNNDQSPGQKQQEVKAPSEELKKAPSRKIRFSLGVLRFC